ncbi:ABC transporter substrate-binding protein [Candidatus Parcubacteria bacterium]|nr:ABC transporter substrate-binding protein [Candidatus Parcubacteria bacterium]
MKKSFVVSGIIFVFFFFVSAQFCFSADSQQSDPMLVVKSTIDRVIAILGDPKYVGKKSQQRDDVFSVVSPFFSFEEMSKRTLALRWKDVDSEKKKEFTNEFSHLLLNLYYTKISQGIENEDYDVGDIDVRFSKTIFKKDGKLAEIYTVIFDKKKKQETPVSYRMFFSNSDWFVYDVVIGGVCLVQNYKNQFLSASLKEIIEGIKAKNLENDKKFL